MYYLLCYPRSGGRPLVSLWREEVDPDTICPSGLVCTGYVALSSTGKLWQTTWSPTLLTPPTCDVLSLTGSVRTHMLKLCHKLLKREYFTYRYTATLTDEMVPAGIPITVTHYNNYYPVSFLHNCIIYGFVSCFTNTRARDFVSPLHWSTGSLGRPKMAALSLSRSRFTLTTLVRYFTLPSLSRTSWLC